jgi:hypothetical protein
VILAHYTGTMQNLGYGLLRISLPRTRVNKAEIWGMRLG